MKIFFITDNKLWFEKLNRWRSLRSEKVEIFCSPNGKSIFEKEVEGGQISTINLKLDYEKLLNDYAFGFSCHCKQIFPIKLVEKVKCFNFHPGFNPYNRGWFPQVFSIINGLPVGATVHKMDKEIDHGAILTQEEVPITEADTSKSVYDKIMSVEFRLFDENIDKVLADKYSCFTPHIEGNYNSVSDFKELCEIDLDKKVTFREAINYLRATTFDGYENAYFYDQNGLKVYISINVKCELA
jgi:dTDP-4-amino-4,6-dideoxyglucose formyltransferase